MKSTADARAAVLATHHAHPARAGVERFLAAYLVLTALMVGLGLLVTHSLHGITRWDVSVNRWFVHQRIGGLNTATQIGSHLAETLTVIAVGLVIVIWLAWRKDWTSVGLLVIGILLEVSVFLTTTLLVDRQRPPVPKLDTAPPTSSFPSGHTAASIALYIGLLIVIHRRMRPNAARTFTEIVLLLVPVSVGLSRLYRGMHHPTDVLAGVLLGALCLVIARQIVTVVLAPSAGSEAPTPSPLRRRAETRDSEEVRARTLATGSAKGTRP